jgi:hypothetical protein
MSLLRKYFLSPDQTGPCRSLSVSLGYIQSLVYYSCFEVFLDDTFLAAFFNTRLAVCSVEKSQPAIILRNEVCYLRRHSCKQDETLVEMEFGRERLTEINTRNCTPVTPNAIL